MIEMMTETTMKKKLSIQSSIVWNSVGSMFYLGCQWLMTVLVVRISGIQEAGLLSLSMSATNIWYCLAVYGMRNFQTSDTLSKYPDGTYLFSRLITIGLSFLGCVVYVLAISYDWYQRACILCYFLYKSTEAFYDAYAGIFQKNWRLDFAGRSMIQRGILSLAAFVAVLKLTGSLLLTFGCMAASCLLSVLLYDVRTAQKLCHPGLNTDLQKIRRLLTECFPLVIYTILSSAIGTIPRLYMERILGSYKLGIYGTVATPTLIIQMGATYVFNPFVTLFAERYYQKNKKGFFLALGRCMAAVGAIAAAGILGGRLLGRWGLNFLYGDEVASYYELLNPLILCTVITAFSWLLCGVLTAVREFRGLVAGNLAAAAASVLLSGILERRYDMQGASLALGIATLIEILILCLFLWKNLQKQFDEAKPEK